MGERGGMGVCEWVKNTECLRDTRCLILLCALHALYGSGVTQATTGSGTASLATSPCKLHGLVCVTVTVTV